MTARDLHDAARLHCRTLLDDMRKPTRKAAMQRDLEACPDGTAATRLTMLRTSFQAEARMGGITIKPLGRFGPA